ncbi:multidrug efflux SMR transporter [Brevibacterium samyangense]|uniref:Quaternary ammonium compound-resistance protein SugE n=1 Tax=Brevibacterium samyangense TaxID=366888 RepID=A0ABP5EMH8_9MICO
MALTPAAPGPEAPRTARRPSASRAWTVLLVSAVLEAVWASALGASEGLSRPLPTAVFLVALAASMLGLGHAARTIPMSTAYAVWTGIGAALTVAWAMATGTEPITALRLLFLAGIIGAVIGLKAVGAPAKGPHGDGVRQERRRPRKA